MEWLCSFHKMVSFFISFYVSILCASSVLRTRDDGLCGRAYPLSDGSPAECNAMSAERCCSLEGICSASCCPQCVDYSIVNRIRNSESSCVIAERNGFLHNVCFDETTHAHYFKCIASEELYEIRPSGVYSEVCAQDPLHYQVCGARPHTQAEGTLCGWFLCANSFDNSTIEVQNTPCKTLDQLTYQNCSRLLQDKSIQFQIPESKRCVEGEKEPYCADYFHQTNCSGQSLVSGRCIVNSFWSNISRVLVCGGKKAVCDDNTENMCVEASPTCTVHKHRLCDGVEDCEGGMDEERDECRSMTETQTCVRKFSPGQRLGLPHSWLMDSVVDCEDGSDEEEGAWDSCLEARRVNDTINDSMKCDGRCEGTMCQDENECNGFNYGMVCQNDCNLKVILSAQHICNGLSECLDDEKGCEVNDNVTSSCLHYEQKVIRDTEKLVPIWNFTRCSTFDLDAEPSIYPYCLNFHDQINCTDVGRVGGQCQVGGYLSGISKNMMCKNLTTLCDDNMENHCLDVTQTCQIHRHRLCDGVPDCPGGADENHIDCRSMTSSQQCERKFGIRGKALPVPFSWILDNVTDCVDGMDENSEVWYTCEGGRGVNPYPCTAPEPPSGTVCDGKCDLDSCEDESNCNVYYYGVQCTDEYSRVLYVAVDEVCDGTENCVQKKDEPAECKEANPLYSCQHSVTKQTVPLLNYTRCAVFDLSGGRPRQYCADYTDQTNCTDPARVGGTCEVGGYKTTISNTMVCGGFISVCDDNSENLCTNTSAYCTLHKHKLCDGFRDCPDGSDEEVDGCRAMTRGYNCERRFGGSRGKLEIPLSWLMDGVNDCEDGLDEDAAEWTGCLEFRQDQEMIQESWKCNGICETKDCLDEVYCNGILYGMICQNMCNINVTLIPQYICDGSPDCLTDESNCNVSNVPSCPHYHEKIAQDKVQMVPIHPNVRCSIFDLEAQPPVYPYCWNFRDQTNCSDQDRVGGHCLINGYPSNVSKIMVCKNYPQLCDSADEKNCVNVTSTCLVHKHHICDGVEDCPDGSDEKRDECDNMTKEQRCARNFGTLGKPLPLPHSWIMDGEPDCIGGIDEDNGTWEICLSLFEIKTTIITEEICDGKCDKKFCTDESSCNGFSYGMTCTNRCNMQVHVPAHLVCDGSENCLEDERDCEVENTFTLSCALFTNKSRIAPIKNFTRCSIFDMETVPPTYPYCWNYHDQTNCSDVARIGGHCEIDGFFSTVARTMICGGYNQLCDDGSENNCVSVTSSCRIHKHRLCDGVNDCGDGSDEMDCEFSNPMIRCVRRYGLEADSMALPDSWILDGEKDCMGGEDEDERWRKEEMEELSDYVFICPGVGKGTVNVGSLCDSVESCGGREAEVCWVLGAQIGKKVVVKETGSGVKDLCENEDSVICNTKEFPYSQAGVFGVSRTLLKLPSTQLSCSNKFGEYYVYLSCMGLCESSTPCPLTYQPRVLEHDACPGQYTDRVFTLADNTSLTFAIPANNTQQLSIYHQQYFQCQNGRCVDFSQVCDLVDNCGDMSDEMNCTNHFQCRGGSNHLVGQSQKCDGIYDCLDLSDECNDECSKRLFIKSKDGLISFIIGLLSIILNLTVLSSPCFLKRLPPSLLSRASNFTMKMVTLGNLLQGVYLVMIAVFDWISRENYCMQEGEWRSGRWCAFLGVISTFGSLLSFSFFNLLLLSILVLKTPAGKHFLTVSSLSVIPLAILALLPIVPIVPLQERLVENVAYNESRKLFAGVMSKAEHLTTLQAYYPNTILTTQTTWQEIGSLVDGMFTKSVPRTQVHFYGNSGLCLFKYMLSVGQSADFMTLIVFCVYFLSWICLTALNVFSLVGRCAPTRLVSRVTDKNHCLYMLGAMSLSYHSGTVLYILLALVHNSGALDLTSWNQLMSTVLLPLPAIIVPLCYLVALARFVDGKGQGKKQEYELDRLEGSHDNRDSCSRSINTSLGENDKRIP